MCGSGTSSLVDVDRCPQYACYFADKLVDWLRVDRPGCRDCRRPSASGLRNDSGDDLKCDGDNRSLYHRVLIELIAHRRTIQVRICTGVRLETSLRMLNALIHMKSNFTAAR